MIRKVMALLLVVGFALLANAGCSKDSGSADFTFAIITDVHADPAHADTINQLVGRLNADAPDFVVNLGDLIFEGNTATEAQAREWYDVYQNAVSGLQMPVYNAVGCHDVVGIGSDNQQNTDFSYGKGLFLERFAKDGRSYYSFDQGSYHCIVLDPNDLINGEQVYRLPQEQLQWLEGNLAAAGDAQLLFFFSEPTVNWTNRSQFVRLLQGRTATFFSGHLHQDLAMTFNDFPEQVTAAVSGEWWQGVNPDGRPPGYRLVTVKGDTIDSLYKGIEEERTIDPNLETIVDGKVDLAVKIDSHHGAISSASYQVDGGETVSMTLEQRSDWSVATAAWDTSASAEGYHEITFRARDDAGAFEKTKQIKVSATKTVSPSELNAHLTTYQGNYVSIAGVATYVYLGPLSISGFDIPEGLGFVYLTDDTEGVVVLPAEVLSPSLSIVKSEFKSNDRVIMKVVPVRMSMAYVYSTQEWTQYFERIKDYISFVPVQAREPRDAFYLTDLVAVWGTRWVNVNDLTFTSA